VQLSSVQSAADDEESVEPKSNVGIMSIIIIAFKILCIFASVIKNVIARTESASFESLSKARLLPEICSIFTKSSSYRVAMRTHPVSSISALTIEMAEALVSHRLLIIHNWEPTKKAFNYLHTKRKIKNINIVTIINYITWSEITFYNINSNNI
jgi:hypothetical protein